MLENFKTAQQMFKELGYKEDRVYFFSRVVTYINESRYITLTENGVSILKRNENDLLVSLTIEEVEAIYKQMKELERHYD